MQGRARCAVMPAFSGPLELREYPLRMDPEPGASWVRVEAAGVCGTDVHLWKGQLPVPLPLIMGHETVGRIECLGEGLTHDWSQNPLGVGDRVTWSSGVFCNSCYFCKVKVNPSRCIDRKAYGISYNCDESPHFLGGYAEYIYLRPGTAIFKLPHTLSTEAVVGSGCALVTAVHGLERLRIEWNDVVVIQGTGPVGISALALAKSSGAQIVIVVGGPDHRLAIAKRFGADYRVNIDQLTSPSHRIERVKELCADHGAPYGPDVVIECAGVPEAFAEGIEMVRDGGKYLVLGHYADAGALRFNPHWITRKQITIYGSWASEPRHMYAALQFLESNPKEFPFELLVTHRFPLERADDALQATAKWTSGKSVIVPHGD
ncbi:MAG: zinc-binding dehydrogenase [Armatimonadetes bacterium]|nr:zinc-binding dehydrogenase [Armatimonadota bacterium]